MQTLPCTYQSFETKPTRVTVWGSRDIFIDYNQCLEFFIMINYFWFLEIFRFFFKDSPIKCIFLYVASTKAAFTHRPRGATLQN